MRIALDVQGLQTESSKRGIGRYIRNLLAEFMVDSRSVEFILVFNGDAQMLGTYSPADLLKDDLNFESAIWYPSDLKFRVQRKAAALEELEEILWIEFLTSLKLDAYVYLSPFEGFQNAAYLHRPVSHVSTWALIFDLIPYVNNLDYLDSNPDYKNFYLSRVIKLCGFSNFLTLSDSEGFLIKKLLGPGQAPTAIGAGIDKAFLEAKSNNYQPESDLRTFVVLGGGDPRKNLELVVEEFVQFLATAQDPINLELVGHLPEQTVTYLQKRIPRKFKKRVVFSGHLSDSEVVDKLQKSDLMIFASSHEGFGLPVLEAASLGLPVLCLPTATNVDILGESYPGYFELGRGSLSTKLTMTNASALLDLRSYIHEESPFRKHNWSETADKFVQSVKNLRAADRVGMTPIPNESRSELSSALEVARAIAEHETLSTAIKLSNFVAKNVRSSRKARIFVDVSELAKRDAATGIQRVVKQILGQMAPIVGDAVTVIPVEGRLDGTGYYYSAYLPSGGLRLSEDLIGQKISVACGDVFLALDLQHHIVLANSDYLQTLRRNGVFVAFVLYDLLPIQFPQFWPDGNRVAELHASWLRIISEASLVVGISRTVEAEYRDWANSLDVELPNSSWFHIGADFDNESDKMGAQPKLPKQGSAPFLMVGTLEPRKGHEQVLDVFDQVWSVNRNVPLVFIGKKGWLVDNLVKRIENLKRSGYPIEWLNSASDSTLDLYYQNSIAVISASFGEGFGLPIVEAELRGCHVIARDIPIFREVASSDTDFFQSNQDLQNIIFDALSSYTGKRVIPNRSHITWEESAKMLVSRIAQHHMGLKNSDLNLGDK